MGTRELYEWMHLNSMIEMHPVEFTNDPNVIGLNDNMVSINSALTRRPAGPGGGGHDGRAAVFGDRRAGGLRPRLPRVEGRPQHHRAGGGVVGRDDARASCPRSHRDRPSPRRATTSITSSPTTGSRTCGADREGTGADADRDRRAAVPRLAARGVRRVYGRDCSQGRLQGPAMSLPPHSTIWRRRPAIEAGGTARDPPGQGPDPLPAAPTSINWMAEQIYRPTT